MSCQPSGLTVVEPFKFEPAGAIQHTRPPRRRFRVSVSIDTGAPSYLLVGLSSISEGLALPSVPSGRLRSIGRCRGVLLSDYSVDTALVCALTLVFAICTRRWQVLRRFQLRSRTPSTRWPDFFPSAMPMQLLQFVSGSLRRTG